MTLTNIGTAGWSIPRSAAAQFGNTGTSLERYAARLHVAEINSSFYRPHRISTWARWRDFSPPHFRFSVKVPKAITHQHKLIGCGEALGQFVAQAGTLGEKLAVYLVQLPPSLQFDEASATVFFTALRALTPVGIACEPRHASWFTAAANDLLTLHSVARVAADPAVCDAGGRPGGWSGFAYWRLHGSPAMYRSSYANRIAAIARNITAVGADQVTWCIFDNTASGAATLDALALQQTFYPDL